MTQSLGFTDYGCELFIGEKDVHAALLYGLVQLLDLCDQRIIVDDVSPRCIDKDRTIFELGERIFVDHASRLTGCGAMKRKDVCIGKKATQAFMVLRAGFKIAGQPAAVVIMNLHTKSAGSGGQGLTDPAHA